MHNSYSGLGEIYQSLSTKANHFFRRLIELTPFQFEINGDLYD